LFLVIAAGQFSLAADTTDNTMFIGPVWTGNPSQPWAEALGVEGERIVAVGAVADVRSRLGDSPHEIDASKGLVVPGFCDSHIHLIDGGMRLSNVQLRDAKTRAEFVRRIGEFAKQSAAADPERWVSGGDWDHTLWGGELPDRAWIDGVTPRTPVWIERLDGHMALANTAAMRAAGVKDDVADVDGGEIVRDASGRPTGIFKDNAMSLITRAVPEPSIEQQLSAAVAAMKYLAEQGVTSVHHMGTWSDVDVYRLAKERGLMTARVYAFTPLAQWKELEAEVRGHGRGDRWLQLGGLKGYVDGSLGSHTAAFLEPYTDDPASRGLLVNTQEDLEAWTKAADKAGLQVAVHAIGDRAIRIQLDVFEQAAKENGPRDRRFRIEHAQHIARDDIARFAQLDVIASMQPYHAIDDGRWADPLIGAARCQTSYAFRSLLDAGARLAFGSDWYVAPATPLEGIDAAVTRRTLDGKNPGGWYPQQRIPVEDALRAYTSGAAFAGFAEKELGTLEVGKLADIVVVDRNIVRDSVTELQRARVQLTMVGGRVVYERSQTGD
jgi:hypothetical protein